MLKQQMTIPEQFEDVIKRGPYPIRFPKAEILDQDEEWCEVFVNEEWKRIRFHDYHEVYEIPGLYETIFYRTLRCNSPVKVSNLMYETLQELGENPENLRVLDFGAGNGMAGEAFHVLGSRKIVGLDILEEAKKATFRDRPWVYEGFYSCDITKIDRELEKTFQDYGFNCLLIVAALGYGDIPPSAFFKAYDFIQKGGYLALNIKEDFLKEDSNNTFARFINEMSAQGIIQVQSWKRYQHRLSITGEPLYYVAMTAIKLKEIPSSWRTATNISVTQL